MSLAAGIRQGLLEGRGLWSELRDDPVRAEGAVVVCGMLAEQLARQLGAGAEPGEITRSYRAASTSPSVHSGSTDVSTSNPAPRSSFGSVSDGDSFCWMISARGMKSSCCGHYDDRRIIASIRRRFVLLATGRNGA